jgi:aminoglycoside phosphotransferase (APT) family kinase protein
VTKGAIDVACDRVGELLGGQITQVQRLVAGNSRTSLSLRVATETGSRQVVARIDTGDGPFSDTPFTIEREAAVYRSLAKTALRAPPFLGFDRGGKVLVTEHVAGTAEWDSEIGNDLLRVMGDLHATEVRALGFPDPPSSARHDLDVWAQMARDRIEPASEIVGFAGAFLRDCFPGEPEQLVLVHGDAGPGNTLSESGRINAVLDWEVSHLGDPHDDLATFTVRSALHGDYLPGLSARVDTHYAPRVAHDLDDGRLRYWQAVSLFRNLTASHMSVANPRPGKDRLFHHILIPPLESALVRVLAELCGVELEAVPELTHPGPVPGASTLTRIAADLRELESSVTGEYERQRMRRANYLLGQLAETWPLAFAAAERDLSGPAPVSPADQLQRFFGRTEAVAALFPRSMRFMDARALPRLTGEESLRV